ncbi:MAG TPA: glycosyltransferase family 4 protein [Gammaproteobacteria bacterium]
MTDNVRKVLVATTVHNPQDNRVFLKQVASLRKAGWHVLYLCRRAGCPESSERLTVLPVSMPRHRFLRILAGNLVLSWRALFSGASVLHVHDPELFLVARLLSWRFHRVVIDLHELPHEQIRYKPYLRESLKRPLAFLVEAVLRVILYRATVVVAESSYLEWVSRSASRTVLARNFPAIPHLPPPPLRQNGNASELRLGYVGVISRARCMDMVAAALRDVAHRLGKKVTLRLIGSFDSDELEREVLSCNGVEYLGFRPNDEAQRLLAAVDIGISLTARTPNYDHSLSTKIPEYLLLGLPVIASDNPINRELFADFPTVRMIDPGSRESFTAAVTTFDEAPPAVRLREDARHRVVSEMNWETEFARLLEIYEAAVEPRT